ncbi:MAG: hypothetical protein AB2792_12580 [Candidatus Thiodiazotropha sp.]
MTVATPIATVTATIVTESIGAARVMVIVTATNIGAIAMVTNIVIAETVGIEWESRDAQV